MSIYDNPPVVVRGGGDLATGTIYRLHKAGFPVIVLEIGQPLAVRRAVSVCEAVYEGRWTVEGMECRLISSLDDFDPGVVGVLIDPGGKSLAEVRPRILIDAIMAKRNTGTSREMAPVTIALGPGFCAPRDVHYVIETMRGHSLGRVIAKGTAIPDTNLPGVIMGCGIERLLRAPAEGRLVSRKTIGDLVEAGEVVGEIAGVPVQADIPGVIRGLIHPSVECRQGMKIGDVDPRGVIDYCFTISEKSLAVAGGVMEAVSYPNR